MPDPVDVVLNEGEEVEIGGSKYRFREVSWVESKKLIGVIRKILDGLKTRNPEAKWSDMNADQITSVLVGNIDEVINSGFGTAQDLVCSSTGLQPAEVEALPASTFFGILTESILAQRPIIESVLKGLSRLRDELGDLTPSTQPDQS